MILLYFLCAFIEEMSTNDGVGIQSPQINYKLGSPYRLILERSWLPVARAALAIVTYVSGYTGWRGGLQVYRSADWSQRVHYRHITAAHPYLAAHTSSGYWPV